MEWLQATPAERVVMEANTLAMRVEAYGELDRINDDVEADVDGMERLHDPDTFAQRFVTERVDGSLERAAYLAGRWADQDPVIAGQLDRLRSTLTDVAAAPAVDDHDMREVRVGSPTRCSAAGTPACWGWRGRKTNAQRAYSPRPRTRLRVVTSTRCGTCCGRSTALPGERAAVPRAGMSRRRRDRPPVSSGSHQLATCKNAPTQCVGAFTAGRDCCRLS